MVYEVITGDQVKECPKCKKEFSDQSVLCPFCSIVLEQPEVKISKKKEK